MNLLRRILAIIVPLAVLAGAGFIAFVLLQSAPEAERRRPQTPVPVVEVQQVEPVNWQVHLDSRGVVNPRTRGTLIPEVSGRIVYVAEQLRGGSVFHEGDVLVRIDPRNYENAVTIARAEAAQAEQTLAEEQARVEQAVADWSALGLQGEPDALVRREPQLASAKAAVAAAKARLSQALIDLERTRLLAPYTGRVLSLDADIGQFVNSGSTLASIYALDYVEVRLPLAASQLEFLDLPSLLAEPLPRIPVELSARIGARHYQWPARIVRTDGAVDSSTRQWFVIAQVDAPYERVGDRPPLNVGQFVTARIEGRELEDVFVLPLSVLRSDGRVTLMDGEDTVRLQEVELLRRVDDRLLIRGLEAGDRVVTTALPFAVNGTRVRLGREQLASPPVKAAAVPAGVERGVEGS